MTCDLYVEIKPRNQCSWITDYYALNAKVKEIRSAKDIYLYKHYEQKENTFDVP